MDASVSAITLWTCVEECPIPQDVTALLVPEERAIAAYKTFRDSAVFTTKRLIVRDAQGIRAFINGWNESCHPFVWTKTSEEILTKANSKPISNTRH